MTAEEIKVSIEGQLIKFLMKVTGYKQSFIQENINSSLTGDTFHLEAVDLVYYLLLISDYYKISFCSDNVENYLFNTIPSIAEIIVQKTRY